MYWILILFFTISGLSSSQESPDMLRIHDFHTSLAEIEYNTNSKSFEVSLRVFTDDLEQALSQKNDLENLSLDKTKKYNHLIEAYIKHNFYLIDPKNQQLPISFLGKELDDDVTWVYFEMPFRKYKPGYKMRNSILTELFDDQVNFINLKYKGQKESYLLKRGKVNVALILE